MDDFGERENHISDSNLLLFCRLPSKFKDLA